MKLKNRRKANNNYDPSSVDSNSYNDAAGARKTIEVGHHLKPIKTGATTFTTDCSTKTKVGKGISLAIFGVADGSVTIGDSTVAILATGVTDANGFVGIPVMAEHWIYLNTYTYDYIITSSADIKVFIIEDDTYIINTP
ncbi:MAG TPA: hypothetical protein VI911_11950 [Patescibacteria group bacterium]|nr:hypothetical protein [Patescibacteria group bacterium]